MKKFNAGHCLNLSYKILLGDQRNSSHFQLWFARLPKMPQYVSYSRININAYEREV